MSPLLANLLADAEGPDTALLLPEVKAEDMRLLLQFIYQGEVVLPPRRTAALLDLATLLCVAGVRGGSNGPTPPSPPRSDSPELDCCDRNESDHVSEDEQHNQEPSTPDKDSTDKSLNIDDDNSDAADIDDDAGAESNDDAPMNLAAKPEVRPDSILYRNLT